MGTVSEPAARAAPVSILASLPAQWIGAARAIERGAAADADGPAEVAWRAGHALALVACAQELESVLAAGVPAAAAIRAIIAAARGDFTASPWTALERIAALLGEGT